jgi:L-rhamnose mutarotase
VEIGGYLCFQSDRENQTTFFSTLREYKSRVLTQNQNLFYLFSEGGRVEVICEVMKLKPDSVKDYVEMHKNSSQELISAIRESGFLEEYIYLLGNLVIVIMKCENFEKSRKCLLGNGIFQKWTEKVQRMLMEDEDLFNSKEKIIDLKPLWNLKDF